MDRLKLPAGASLVEDLSQLSAALSAVARGGDWKPRVNEERTRGPGLRVYPLVAPAIVVVRSGHGDGTGFIIDPEGWIVTNHHVIADADIDPNTNTRVATIHIGRLKDG